MHSVSANEGATNVYMNAVPDVRRGATLLAHIQRYFNKMMDAFGVTPLVSTGVASESTTGVATGEEVGMPFFSLFCFPLPIEEQTGGVIVNFLACKVIVSFLHRKHVKD